MKAYKHLVKYALGLGHTVSVDDGDYDDMPVVNSQGYKEIIDAIESVDISNIYITAANGEKLGTAFIVLEFNQEDEESVCDYSVTPFMDSWDREFMIAN